MKKLATLIVVLATVVVLAPAIVSAKHKQHEKWYQEVWCSAHGGDAEVILNDDTRVDCATDTHAIEVDFARKWYEAVGQALHYGMKTGKHPGVLLIIEDLDEMKYWDRMNAEIKYWELPITTWFIMNIDAGGNSK